MMIVFNWFIRAGQKGSRNHNLLISLSTALQPAAATTQRRSSSFHLFLVFLVVPGGLRCWESRQDIYWRSQLHPDWSWSWGGEGRHSVVFCIAGGQVESRPLFSFEERICGEVVGDDVVEGWTPLTGCGGLYGTDRCEKTAEQDNVTHHHHPG